MDAETRAWLREQIDKKRRRIALKDAKRAKTKSYKARPLCKGKYLNGKPCRFRAQLDQEYCGQHRPRARTRVRAPASK